MSQDLKHKILVNAITSLRVIGAFSLIPIFLLINPLAAGLTVAILFCTDFIDGSLARHFNCTTFFGSLLDGLSDKLLGIISLGLLATIAPVYCVPILMEIGILGINYYSIKQGNNAQSRLIGKLKTWVLGLTISLGFIFAEPNLIKNILPNYNWQVLANLLGPALIMADAITIFDYTNNIINQSNTIKEPIKAETLIQKKNREEIKHDLFDTQYYLNNKDKGIRNLFYKEEMKRNIDTNLTEEEYLKNLKYIKGLKYFNSANLIYCDLMRLDGSDTPKYTETKSTTFKLPFTKMIGPVAAYGVVEKDGQKLSFYALIKDVQDFIYVNLEVKDYLGHKVYDSFNIYDSTNKIQTIRTTKIGDNLDKEIVPSFTTNKTLSLRKKY